MMPVCGPAIFARGATSPLSSRLKMRMLSFDSRPPLSSRLATTIRFRFASAARP